MSYLIDTHCHLNMEQFHDDMEIVIQRANEANVKYLHTICTKLEELDAILEIAEKYKNIYASCGVHPHHARRDSIPSVETLIKLSKHDKIISFGETGLDYYYPDQDVNAQKQSFINHIIASQSEQLPVIVHTRDAENDTLDIIVSEMKDKTFPGVIHCFTASYNFAKKAIDNGFYISIAGIVTFKNASILQYAVSKLPLDRLLIETDSPYLAPIPHRGKRNEPAFVKHTAEFLAGMLGKSFQEIQDVTTNNAKMLFAKAKFD